MISSRATNKNELINHHSSIHPSTHPPIHPCLSRCLCNMVICIKRQGILYSAWVSLILTLSLQVVLCVSSVFGRRLGLAVRGDSVGWLVSCRGGERTGICWEGS